MKYSPVEEFSRIYKLDNFSKTLIENGKELFFKKNTVIASPGDIMEGFYFVKEGRVIASEFSPKGNERIMCILEKSSIFLESNVLFDVPVFCYFKTTVDTTLIFLKKEVLLDLLAKDLNVTLFLLQSLTKKFYSNMNHIDELLYHDTEWGMCNLFLTLAENFGVEEDTKIKLNIKISQQFISNLLGINRITTLRNIKKLKELMLIEQTNGYYYIKDIQKLRDYQTMLQAQL
ncbi:transcriptional regulator, Crp [Dehalobacter sp. UNSWDHB]|jgi:cAMP-binding proteins - catabolite gene activator and regulatory subunit of cAMP-dependent protein kinases|uniref:Crp/Fnr family transcriptional regulator n=1 Tax=unclassified Dehalobacter TaxID=2635733 RepID=UPI00028B959C|nr:MULTISPECIES: Crp/Fnr family transcriptional regulator [unclassified Dehalobacter]AFV03403.1 transcriptional regulator, Crp/Fnr family [Dehalobacter sp. DCA]AFV06390.1 transcriptional regulator, Crp/Fnr family [Dehalobacter sp. CF]EQB21095.1 transcriptional regulator, Crp [Dehalobacter sp. UNSWDHB]